ncbi:hypothetical protein [Kineosporia babensis]|uniref:Uncharacterized protein n=1 Tax=Kineosporia babensis TaxID=499548 RepID=A0A9X1SY44_9ACTN|nr:hypothetical protein [Kineosporia babensis]MCD5315925.1 hypothetical protein [Kineosporia babensis]
MGEQKFRAVPVFGLALLAPFCGEYLLGSITLHDLVNLPWLMPLYGAAALLVREFVRGSGRGWPSILLLGAAFGAVLAGAVDASMFDPDYAGYDLSGPVVPGIDWNIYWGMAFIVTHAIYSIALPIAIVEALSERGGDHAPWMGQVGYWSTVAWLGGGFALIGADSRTTEDYWPTLPQQGFTVMLALAFVALAYPGDNRLSRFSDRKFGTAGEEGGGELGKAERGVETGQSPGSRQADHTTGSADRPTKLPSPVLTWLTASLVLLLFNVLPPTWLGATTGIVLAVGSFLVGVWLSRKPGWSEQHRLALAAAAITVGAPFSFVVGDFTGFTDGVSLLGYGLFGLVAGALLLAGFRYQRREETAR